MRWPLEVRSVRQAHAWWQQPVPRPEAAPRSAATVMLVRECGGPGVEVFVLRRHTTMAFAPGMVVFPGGGVDPGDTDVREAAVRELFEETGVLLASDAAGAFPDTREARWEDLRIGVESRTVGFAEALATAGLRARTDLLLPWSRWVSPRFLPRRYDTWFFLALLPAGQQARHVVGEAVASQWAGPAELLAGNELMRPTRETLLDLDAAGSWAALLAAASGPPRSMQPQLSELVVVDGAYYLEQEMSNPRPSRGGPS